MSEWTKTTLGDIACKNRTGIVDGPFGSNLPASDYTSFGIPVIRGVNLSLGKERFCNDNYVFVSEQTANRLNRSLCVYGDIIFTKKGTLGQTGIVPLLENHKAFLISSNQMKLSVDKSLANSLFVYYYVSSPSSRARILSDAMTTGVPKINLGYLRKFQIILPPLPIQQKIAAIVSAYDDLIENNDRRITLLEKMAEEIYREWFVRLRFPGHEQVTFHKGIPEGWEIKKLEDVVELAYGKALREEDRISGNYPVFGSGGVVGTHKSYLVKAPGIIIGRKGNVGSVHWSEQDFYPIDTVYYIKSDLSFYFLFFLVQSLNFINNDAAVPGLNRNQAYSNKFYLPPQFLINKYAKNAKSIFNTKNNLKRKNELLKQTRDRLLTRLISGKLSVEDLDIQFLPSMTTDP